MTHSGQIQDGRAIPNASDEYNQKLQDEAIKNENLYNLECNDGKGNGKVRKYDDGRLLPPDVISPKPVKE